MRFDKNKINRVNASVAKRSVVATGIGNAMEWFDFGLYSYLAVIISKNFFSDVQNDQLKLVFTFATFAIAFLLRPVGGIIFGIIGDKFGRKIVLTITIVMMAISTVLIGCLPTYDQIGIWAPILLLIGRIIQGFSTGGEYAGAMVYVAETSPDNRRNSLGSGLEIGTLSGYIAASVLCGVLFFSLNDQQMAAWGWRIPFFFGLILGFVGLYLRTHLEETPIYENELSKEDERDKISFWTSIRFYYKDIIVCFVMVVFFNVTNYMVTSYLPSYLEEVIGVKNGLVTVLITCIMAIMIPLALFYGKTADKIGDKKVMLFGLGGIILFSIFAFWLINLKAIFPVAIGILLLGIFLATYEGTMPGTLPTIFFTHIRYRTLAITFNVSVSLFGGTTPLIATALVAKTGNPLMPAFYLTAVSIVGFLVVLFMHTSTASKSLKGSYPNVDSDEDFKKAAENPKKSLWWVQEKRKREHESGIDMEGIN